MKVGDYIRFARDYGGYPMGTIAKITAVWEGKDGARVDKPYSDSSAECNLFNHEFEYIGPTLDEVNNSYEIF